MNHEWLAAAEEDLMTGITMTDMSAAYDLWDHELGLEKARRMWLTEEACSWLSSYIMGALNKPSWKVTYQLLSNYQHILCLKARWVLHFSSSWPTLTYQM